MLETSETVTVSQSDAGHRIDQYIASVYQTYSRSQIQSCIEEGLILLNNSQTNKNHRLKAGDTITLSPRTIDHKLSPSVKAENTSIDILYEDEHLLAINKPSGQVVHPGHGNKSGTLVNALLYHVPQLADGFNSERPGIVHRLDKDTSGVLLVAKNNVIHAQLAALFADRHIDKMYMGMCVGNRPSDHDTIDAALGPSRSDPTKRAVIVTGKSAVTEYWCLNYQNSISVVRFKLHTGRTHQIRVHCNYKGFSIVGDDDYQGGRDAVKRLAPLDRGFAASIYKCFNRHALHAHRLSFMHPITKKILTVIAPLPDDFNNAFKLFKIQPDLSFQSIGPLYESPQ